MPAPSAPLPGLPGRRMGPAGLRRAGGLRRRGAEQPRPAASGPLTAAEGSGAPSGPGRPVPRRAARRPPSSRPLGPGRNLSPPCGTFAAEALVAARGIQRGVGVGGGGKEPDAG